MPLERRLAGPDPFRGPVFFPTELGQPGSTRGYSVPVRIPRNVAYFSQRLKIYTFPSRHHISSRRDCAHLVRCLNTLVWYGWDASRRNFLRLISGNEPYHVTRVIASNFCCPKIHSIIRQKFPFSLHTLSHALR